MGSYSQSLLIDHDVGCCYRFAGVHMRLTPERLAEDSMKHVKFNDYDECKECGHDWPCSTREYLDLLAERGAEYTLLLERVDYLKMQLDGRRARHARDKISLDTALDEAKRLRLFNGQVNRDFFGAIAERDAAQKKLNAVRELESQWADSTLHGKERGEPWVNDLVRLVRQLRDALAEGGGER